MLDGTIVTSLAIERAQESMHRMLCMGMERAHTAREAKCGARRACTESLKSFDAPAASNVATTASKP